jgi:small redox-active disulfide protein 2
MISVAGNRIGMIGLEKIFEEAKNKGIQGNERLRKELVERAGKTNYIPPSSEGKYGAVLVDEYRRFLGGVTKEEERLDVKTLGPGCARCDQLEREVMNVLATLALPANVEHVRDVTKLKHYGAFGTPALIVNRKVKSVGRVPSKSEITQWLE